MDEQEKKEPTSTKEIDPFTALMFGMPTHKSNRSQTKEKQQKSAEAYDSPFDKSNRNESTKEEKNGILDLLNGVDPKQLMKNVDLLIETTQEMKPLWKKISPYLDKWKK